ncbi:MAG TPA: M23 family metallopeptidase [Candidatus Angelobacter sp.]|nr:M23 family metallopeptidase [Candidatus Angelobacter sp.]
MKRLLDCRPRLQLFISLGAVLAGLLLPTSAAGKNPQPCGAGVTVRLSAVTASQGSLLLLEVRSRTPITELSAEWNSKNVPFWKAKSASPNSKAGATELRRALLGVDLEKAPGAYPAVVHVQTANGKPESCTLEIPIVKGRFATERLHVESEYVEPNAEQVKRANEERDQLRNIFDQVTPERLWSGKFRVPLDGVTTGGNFGKRRILNDQPHSPHSGVDFPATTGTPVHATQAGKVVLAKELYFSGNTVVVDHGLGIYTFYGHLSAIDVKVGDTVDAGQILGKVGATGRVTGPHLHWGLTVERARVNPLQLVALLQNE